MPDDPSEKKKVVPWLTLRTDKREIPPALAHELAAIVIEWGTFENALYMDLEQLRRYLVCRRLADQVPMNFRKRIELWKRCVFELFPDVGIYKNHAREICKKGKLVARQRNELVHGRWELAPVDGVFHVMVNREHVNKIAVYEVDTEFVTKIHENVKAVSNAFWGFYLNRMMHGAKGLLTAVETPSPDHPAHPNAPTPDKP